MSPTSYQAALPRDISKIKDQIDDKKSNEAKIEETIAEI